MQQPTPDQLNDAANTVLFMVGAIVLIAGIGGGWLLHWLEKRAEKNEAREKRPLTQREIATMASQIISGKPVQDPRTYVEHHAQIASLQTGMPYRDPPDIDQLKPAGMNADQTNMLADETALIQHLARLTKPSGGYWLSANKLYAAIGGDRETVLAVVRSVRGNPSEPSEPYNPAKHLLLDGGERWIVR